MKKFLRFCFMLNLPLVALIAYYIIVDPFKVIWNYEVYEKPDDFVGLNRGYVSTMHYLDTKDSQKYDSFIFGNSRSISYHIDEWKKYIPKNSICYHYDEAGGAMAHLYNEIRIASEQSDLRNALVILDHGILSRTYLHGHLFEMCPALQNNANFLKFQLLYFKSFYNLAFLKRYVDYYLHMEYKPYMGSYIINKTWKLDYDPSNNELSWARQEESITNGDFYNSDRIELFSNAQFPDSIYDVEINTERLELLYGIKSFFDTHHTNYKIVISPTYDQIKINPNDLKILYSIFGKDNVFDFTGVSTWSLDYHNHYEVYHYRPCVANDVMRIVYTDATMEESIE